MSYLNRELPYKSRDLSYKKESFHPYDWDKFYDLVKRPEEEKKTYHCTNCGLPIEKSEEFCSGGCAQEHYENHILFD
jgi:hypothetical protein